MYMCLYAVRLLCSRGWLWYTRSGVPQVHRARPTLLCICLMDVLLACLSSAHFWVVGANKGRVEGAPALRGGVALGATAFRGGLGGGERPATANVNVRVRVYACVESRVYREQTREYCAPWFLGRRAFEVQAVFCRFSFSSSSRTCSRCRTSKTLTRLGKFKRAAQQIKHRTDRAN